MKLKDKSIYSIYVLFFKIETSIILFLVAFKYFNFGKNFIMEISLMKLFEIFNFLSFIRFDNSDISDNRLEEISSFFTFLKVEIPLNEVREILLQQISVTIS